MDKALLNGRVFSKKHSDWLVTWESDDKYRFWCRQHPANKKFEKDILIIMLNPGSLKTDGSKLGADKTLEVLRDVFSYFEYNCLVVNLFDFADTKPHELFENWKIRNKNSDVSIYDKLDYDKIAFYLFAYG